MISKGLILVDTSVWIEFFNPKPAIDVSPLELLIEERRVVTCLPVRAEVLSGRPSPRPLTVISQAFDSLIYVDPDWSQKSTWDLVIDLSRRARKKNVALPGLVDRMILLACKSSGSSLWTLDRKLQRLAGWTL